MAAGVVLLIAFLLVGRSGVLTGREAFFLRDLGTTHRPAASLFSQLGFARTNPYASFGQPYFGNPNLLVAYPFPKGIAAMSLQIIAHLGLAFVGMFALLRRMSTSGEGAFVAASAFTLSGYVLSATASLNAVTTIGWIPWILWSSLRTRTPAGVAAAGAVISIASIAGEPVLFGLSLLLAALFALSDGGVRALAGLSVSAAAALLLTLPIHLATASAAAESARVQLGFTFRNAASASLHPARLIEILFPFFFGDPSRLLRGAWWGYAVSGGMPAYIGSASVGIIPSLLAGLSGVAARFRRDRFWWATALIAFLLSMSGTIPGSEHVYGALRPLHVIRFPIKFHLFTTLAWSCLAGRGFDYFAAAPNALRKSAVRALSCGIAMCAAAALLARSNMVGIESALVRSFWDPRWKSAPSIVLRPVVESISGRLVAVACLFGVCLLLVGRRRGTFGHIFILAALSVELVAYAGALLPTVPTSVLQQISPLVMHARALQGRVFERTEKDLDPTVFGLRGRYAADDVRELAAVQIRQAWSLTGVQFGIPYAFDPSPDGSYTMRNQRVEDQLAGEGWPQRIKWLRAAGVAGVISSKVPKSTPGLSLVYSEPETVLGIPTSLYAIAQRLPEARRAKHVEVVRTIADAVRTFESPDFNPADAVVIDSPNLGEGPAPGSGGTARILGQSPDRIQIETSGDSADILLVARSYTSYVRATANGAAVAVYPANVHLIGVQVPAGLCRVVVATSP